jgi:Flp pilus assembly protein TadG
MKRKLRRGSQAVEFALILPVLLGISSSIIDYSWYFQMQGEIVDLTKTVVRSASTLDATTSEFSPCQYVQQNLHSSLNQAGYSQQDRNIQSEIDNSTGEARLVVNLYQSFSPLFGLITTPQNSSVRLVMRLEDQNWESC